MIVLDEQLLGRDIETYIATWYAGAVLFITDLRPRTVIKDDAIPMLLRQQPQPTFVTINERDFWRKMAIDQRYCAVCFTLPDSRASDIPPALRTLFHHPTLRTKTQRMGNVIRVTDRETYYYTYSDREVRVIT